MELKFYEANYEQQVLDYQLTDLSFSALPRDCLPESQRRADYQPVLCLEADKLVCFFVLDSGSDKFKYSDNPKSLLLRAFSTDSRMVRKGYARNSLLALVDFVKQKYLECDEIILGVNEGNQVAANLYLKIGFLDTNRRFLGPKGYQIIMSLKI